MRWVVETTNTWWSNYGRPGRNTDRKSRHRHAALYLATTILIISKLLTYRDRWSRRDPQRLPRLQAVSKHIRSVEDAT